jgi:hypothetical protein
MLTALPRPRGRLARRRSSPFFHLEFFEDVVESKRELEKDSEFIP